MFYDFNIAEWTGTIGTACDHPKSLDTSGYIVSKTAMESF